MPFGEDIFVGVGGRTGDTGQKYSSSADDIRQKFTGYQKDSETSLDFAEARMYQNQYGRFTAVDPLIASGKSANPQTFNRYVYVGNSPLVVTDPSGLIGDYFDRNGVYLGTDGKNDGKVYFAVEYGRTKNNRVILDRRTTEETTLEAVLGAQNRAVPLTPGTEREAINFFATMGVQGKDDVTNGVPKGIGNFFIDTTNGVTSFIFHNAGLAPLPDYVPNPFEIKRFTFSTWKEAMYGNAGYTATAAAPFVFGAAFAPAGAPSSVVPQTARVGQFEVGTFSVVDWTGYPKGYSRPSGTFRLLQGEEYANARLLANRTNRTLRSENPGMFKDAHIHEIKPVKFGGSPTNPANKIVIPRSVHEQQFTPWWNQLRRDLQQ